MSVFHSDNDIKLDDVNNPIQHFMKNELYKLSTSIFKEYYQEISEIRVKTDKNILFSSYEEMRGYKFSYNRESVDMRSEHFMFPGTFNEFIFITSGNTQIYIRTYSKFLEVITQIGGFSNGIIFSIHLILYFYSKNIILWHCIFSLISSDEIKENIDKPVVIKLDKEDNFKKIKSDIINIKIRVGRK